MIKWNKMVKEDKKKIVIQHEVYTFYIAYMDRYTFYIAYMDSFQVAIF